MTSSAPALRWTVVVPVKGTDDGKSRMAPELDAATRIRLATAFALDAIDALLGAERVGRVIVVTGSAVLADAVRVVGADVVDDPRAGLNAAVAAGIREAQEPGGASQSGGVAALLGDLPSLRSADVDDALRRASEHPLALVPDAEGTGSTLITALPGVTLVPRFGAGSAARHEEAGHVVLDVGLLSTIRRDVDTAADLETALGLGVGARTATVLGG